MTVVMRPEVPAIDAPSREGVRVQGPGVQPTRPCRAHPRAGARADLRRTADRVGERQRATLTAASFGVSIAPGILRGRASGGARVRHSLFLRLRPGAPGDRIPGLRGGADPQEAPLGSPSRMTPTPPRRLLRPPALLALVLLAVVVAGCGRKADDAQRSEGRRAAPAIGVKGTQPAAAEDLGYPGFATKNTTRVGGADATAIAAAVAQAV